MRNIADNEANLSAEKVKFQLEVSLLIRCLVRRFFIYSWKETKNAFVIVLLGNGPNNLRR